MEVKSLLHRINRHRTGYLMLLPMLFGFFLLLVYPLFWVLRLSFYDYNGMTTPDWIGLENYIRLFMREKTWWLAVAHTAIFAGGKLVLEIPLALVLAVVLNQAIRGRYFFRVIYFLPSVTSTAVMSLIFYHILNPYQGILNGVLHFVGVLKEPIDWLSRGDLALGSAILISVWQFFGLNMILFLAGLQRIPLELYESAIVDGANKVQQFFRITIPMLGKMLQIIMMLLIVASLKIFDLIWVLTRGGPAHETEVMMTYIYKYFFSGEDVLYRYPQIGFGAAMAFVASIIIGVITVIYLYTTRKLGEYEY